MRHRTFTTFTLFAVLAVAGCGGATKQAAHSQPPVRTCTAGAFHRLGSAKLTFAAIVRSHATVSARPGHGAFARFGRLNQNGVPTIFSARGVRVDRRCRRTAYLVPIPRRPDGGAGGGPPRPAAGRRVPTPIATHLPR